MGWIMGNCYDAMVETSQERKAEIMKNVHEGKFTEDDAKPFVDLEEVFRLAEEGRKHPKNALIIKMLERMKKTAERMQKDGGMGGMKDKLEKMKEMNDKMSGELQNKMKDLEAGKSLQIFLGIFALGITLILGIACYCCFYAGGATGRNTKLDEEYMEQLNEYHRKADKLKRLEKEINKEKERLKSEGIELKKSDEDQDDDESAEAKSEGKPEAKPEDHPKESEKEKKEK